MTNQLWTAALFTDLVQTERGWMVRDGTGTVAEKAIRPVLCRLLCCQHRLWMWEHWPSLSREKEPDPGFLLCLSSQAFIDLFERDSIILSDNAHPSVKLPFLEADMGKSKDLMFHESIRRKRERESKPGAAGAERESWNGSWGLSVWRCHHSGWLESWARSLNSSRRSLILKWIFKIKVFFFFFFKVLHNGEMTNGCAKTGTLRTAGRHLSGKDAPGCLTSFSPSSMLRCEILQNSFFLYSEGVL